MRYEIAVISLPNASERRQFMARQLDSLGVDWFFFDAGRPLPNELVYSARLARISKGRPLSPAELGPWSSNFRLWEYFAKQTEVDVLCILHDDVLIDPITFRTLEPVLPLMGELDYLKLYCRVPQAPTYIAPLRPRHLVRFRRPGFGGQAYLLTRNGAKLLLEKMRTIERPLDDALDRFWSTSLPVYCVYPYPVIEVSFPSTIVPCSCQPLSPAERGAYMLNRLRDKALQLAAHGFYRLTKDRELKRRLTMATSDPSGSLHCMDEPSAQRLGTDL